MVLHIKNRTENFKTALSFSSFLIDGSLRKCLVEKLGEDSATPNENIQMELFWQGVRDWLIKRGDSEKNVERLVKECEKILPKIHDDFVEWRKKDKRKFGQSLGELSEKAYNVSERDELANNLRNTEIDVVLDTPTRIYIGEAKYTQEFGSGGSLILVHQLLRQYIVAKALVDVVEPKKEVVPFVIVPASKLENWWQPANKGMCEASSRCPAQVRFMTETRRMDRKNCLTWEDIYQMRSQ